MKTTIDPDGASLTKLLLVIFLPFTCGYFLTAFFNQVNAVLVPYITQSFPLSAKMLGLMTSVYLLAFALFQLPVGLLLDRFGSRRVQAPLLLIGALGAALFASAKSPTLLIIGRSLLGFGMAGGLMSGFKANAMWFPLRRVPLVNGCMMASGTLGALFSTTPVEQLLNFINWRELFYIFAAISIIIALFIFCVVPEKISSRSTIETTLTDQVKGLRVIFTDGTFWRLAPVSAVAFGINMAMVGLWAGPWFTDVGGLNAAQTANHLFAIAVALMFGIFMNGYIADFATRVLNQSIMRVIAIGVFIFILLQMAILFLQVPSSYWLWIGFGFFSRSITLSYSAMTQHFPLHYAGRAITALNFLFFLVGFFIQFAMGAIINLWPANSVGTYPVAAYHTAFLVIVVIEIVCFIWFVSKRDINLHHSI